MKRLILSIIAIAAITACEPEKLPVDMDLVLSLEFDTDHPQGPEMNLETKSDAQAYDVRYIIEAYPEKRGEYNKNKPAGRFVFTKDDINNIDNTITITIQEGKYLFRVWTDYVDAGSTADKFYNTERFTGIKLFGSDEKVDHVGNCDYRDAFTGYKEIDVIRFGSGISPTSKFRHPSVFDTIQMYRPLSKIEFYTNDLVRWKEEMYFTMCEQARKEGKPDPTLDDVKLDDYIVKILYPIYMPNTFNLSEDHTAWSAMGVSFDSKMIEVEGDENKAYLGFDYVFANAVKPTVDMAIALYSKDGKQLARSSNFNVKLERGKVTTVTGSFLMKKSDGGITISTDYDGEFNIF